MDFSWGYAAKIALVGFTGVFIILTILSISVVAINRVVRLLGQEKKQEK